MDAGCDFKSKDVHGLYPLDYLNLKAQKYEDAGDSIHGESVRDLIDLLKGAKAPSSKAVNLKAGWSMNKISGTSRPLSLTASDSLCVSCEALFSCSLSCCVCVYTINS